MVGSLFLLERLGKSPHLSAPIHDLFKCSGLGVIVALGCPDIRVSHELPCHVGVVTGIGYLCAE